MANKTETFGLDAELEAKRLAKYDPKLEEEALQWIKELTERDRGDMSPHEFLKDGVVLCMLINCLEPSSVPKINQGRMAFKQMENINNFLNSAHAYGVPVTDLFQTVDLFEDKNMNQVITAVHALSRESWRRNFGGPKIGVKPADQNKREFDKATLDAGRYLPSQQMGNNRGASQAGMTAIGARREVDHLSHHNIRE